MIFSKSKVTRFLKAMFALMIFKALRSMQYNLCYGQIVINCLICLLFLPRLIRVGG